MRTLKLTVAYDGTNYHGFQKQTNALTVQQVLEEKLSLLCGEKIVTAGSGRTDKKRYQKRQHIFGSLHQIAAGKISSACGLMAFIRWGNALCVL